MKRIELHNLGRARFTFTPSELIEFRLERNGNQGGQVASPASPMLLQHGDIVTIADDCQGLDGLLQLGFAREIALPPDPEPAPPEPEEIAQE